MKNFKIRKMIGIIKFFLVLTLIQMAITRTVRSEEIEDFDLQQFEEELEKETTTEEPTEDTTTAEPSTENPIDPEIKELRAQIDLLQTQVGWLQNQLAIPGLAWFLFFAYLTLFLAIGFIFYALKFQASGLPGTNFFL